MAETTTRAHEQRGEWQIPVGSLVSITSMRLKDPSISPQFLTQVGNVMVQLRSSGVIAQKLYLDEQDPTVYYTVTVWPDIATMEQFRDSGNHSGAMELAPMLSDGTSSVNWIATNNDRLPALEEIQQRLDTA